MCNGKPSPRSRQLHGDRQPIPDVPAVYFVEPTAVNIARIAEDLQNSLYEQIHLNFTSSIPRQLLEDLAQQVAAQETSQTVSKVYDQYLNFESLERNLFTLSMPNMFHALNSNQTTDVEIDGILDRVASSLFSVFLTMGGQPPLICASSKSAAEMVGRKLEKRMRSHMTNIQSSILGESTLGETSSLQRPLLVVLDRNFDLCTPLKHVSTYNALVHDVLGMKLNRINVKTAEGPKAYDIDASDPIWLENAAALFPNAADNIDAALSKYRADMQQVTKNSGINNLDDLKNGGQGGMTLTADELKVAINVLPELTERKRLIDCHLQLATAILEQLKVRNFGDLYLIEQDLTKLTKASVLATIRDPKQGNASDKLRFFLVYYLSPTFAESDAGMLEYERALHDTGCDMSVLASAKKIRATNKMMSRVNVASVSPQSPPSGNDYFSHIGSKATGVLGNLVTGVRNLLPESTETPLTKQIDMALELATGVSSSSSHATLFRSGTHTAVKPEDVLTVIDPRAKPGSPPLSRPTSFSHLIVFVVGGSNYSEYNHVEEWARKRAQQQQLSMTATFGTTDLVTGEEFLAQMGRL